MCARRVRADPFKLQILRDRSFTFPFTFPYDEFHERRRGDMAIARRRDNSGVNDREEEDPSLAGEGERGRIFARSPSRITAMVSLIVSGTFYSFLITRGE